ncbi:hypothetical protein HB4184_14390 [Pseudomonas putida]|nr:hypothetical protein HB4184_14390 [Pseudomonas putida]
MKKKKSITNTPKTQARAGDVFAVPLNDEANSYGYIRAYRDVDVAILPVVSRNRILSIEELSTTCSVLDVFLFRNAIESGTWSKIGNIPFDCEDDEWAPPRKQVAKIRPDLKLVVHKGHFIPASKFGEYDDLAEFLKFEDQDIINEITKRKHDFELI